MTYQNLIHKRGEVENVWIFSLRFLSSKTMSENVISILAEKLAK